MSNQLFIRVDANQKTGTGHFMRCLALAQIWKKKGNKVTFISSCESQVLQDRITHEEYQLIPIKNSYPHSDDLKITLSIINDSKLENCWVVIDGYHFETYYQQQIKNNGNHLLVIDDIAHLDNYVADIILNQNINSNKLDYSCGPNTTLLLGSEFVLLRDEFIYYDNWEIKPSKFANKIMVTMGGNDSENVTLKVLDALNKLNIEDLEIKVVLGSSNRHIDSLKKIVKNHRHNIKILENVFNMPEIMCWADLAISAGGSTCWELAFSGVPIIIIELAENQKNVAKELNKNNIAINLGSHNIVSYEKIQSAINMIFSSKEKRKMMGKYGRNLINGQGRSKVYTRMVSANLS